MRPRRATSQLLQTFFSSIDRVATATEGIFQQLLQDTEFLLVDFGSLCAVPPASFHAPRREVKVQPLPAAEGANAMTSTAYKA